MWPVVVKTHCVVLCV